MVNINTIIDLITAFKSNDTLRIDSILKEAIKVYEKKGQHIVSKRLREVYRHPYYKDNSFSASGLSDKIINSDENSKKLFEIRNSKVSQNDIVLTQENKNHLLRLKEIYFKKEILKDAGVPLETKILLYGPPGTGKTLFAYVIAGELNLPVLHIYLDVLISSFLGETGRNIRNIFEEAKKQDCIIFLDEFDAIAKKRDDAQELGELKRVVTVLLQNIDELDSEKILIAATNHDHLIDRAIRRRFNYEINLELLDVGTRKELLTLYLKKYHVKNLNILSQVSNNLSGARIKQNVFKSITEWILQNKRNKLEDILLEVFIRDYFIFNKETENNSKMKTDNAIKIANYLRGYDNKKYTYKFLESMLKIPDSTIQHLISNKNANK